jgi:outer membrane protein assembly factor BamA
VVPQSAFYMGGSRSLRTLESGSRGGTGKTLARLDVIGAPEAFGTGALAPSPALSFQVGAFAALGAIWGEDPYGLASTPDRDWPDRSEWLGEAGLSFLYRPGLPDPSGLIHFDFAWPVGPSLGRSLSVSIYYARPLHLVRPIVR